LYYRCESLSSDTNL